MKNFVSKHYNEKGWTKEVFYSNISIALSNVIKNKTHNGFFRCFLLHNKIFCKNKTLFFNLITSLKKKMRVKFLNISIISSIIYISINYLYTVLIYLFILSLYILLEEKIWKEMFSKKKKKFNLFEKISREISYCKIKILKIGQ